MLHFPSALQNGSNNGGAPRRTDSLNATQQKPVTAGHQIFLTIEQELHDARRVGSHGQEEDLRSALNMIINRVVELSSLLSEAYKSKAELEVQLNVAKSNLQLVIANNEMLEEALKSGGGRDVGWRRSSAAGSTSAAASTSRPASLDASHSSHSPNPANASPNPNESPTEAASATPHIAVLAVPPLRLFLASLPEEEALSLALQKARADAERERQLAIRERKAADKARADAVAAARDKIALEGEIESLSQALFEEANKMVATERMRRAEAEGEVAKLRAETEKLKPLAQELAKTRSALRDETEELREAREEREALRSALRVIEGENVELRSVSRLSMQSTGSVDGDELGRGRSSMTRSRSSSEVGTKSPVRSPEASPRIPSSSSSPYIPSAASPRIPPSSSSSSSSKQGEEEEEEEPITFAPTGLRAESDDEDAHTHPPTLTPRRVVLAPLPVSDAASDADAAGAESAPATHMSGEDAHSEASEEEELEAELEEWADAASAHAHSVDAQWDRKSARSRTSSPGLSPPPTALAPAPADPWSGA
ncbi:hypothetical protein K438DRAFT_1853317 [Mycena galopus ATCC 62051]|nr:hypothetical protein K438DRAFT_1853317 [Mycena galopus ATCC 62051]